MSTERIEEAAAGAAPAAADPTEIVVGDRVRIVRAVRSGEPQRWMRHLAGCCGRIKAIRTPDPEAPLGLIADVLLDPETPRQRQPRQVSLTLRRWFDGAAVDLVKRIEDTAALGEG